MAIGKLLSSTYLQVLSSLGTASATPKSAQSLRGTDAAGTTSSRTNADTYAANMVNTDVTIFGTLPYAIPFQSSNTADTLSAAKSTAVSDAETAAQAEQTTPEEAKVALNQLAKDMAALADATRANSANQAANLAAQGASSASVGLDSSSSTDATTQNQKQVTALVDSASIENPPIVNGSSESNLAISAYQYQTNNLIAETYGTSYADGSNSELITVDDANMSFYA